MKSAVFHYFFISTALVISQSSISFTQNVSPKIIGGFNVTSYEGFKHQVSIRDANYESSKFGSGHLCGGSLIDYDIVLTAAHCVHSGKKFLSPRLYVVVMGNLNLHSREHAIVRTVSQIIGHKKYNADTFENDIALLKLSSPVPLHHATVHPINLSKLKAAAGQECQSSGWGTIEYSETASAVSNLMAVNLSVNSRESCNDPDSHGGGVGKGMFCAGPFEGGKDTCQGDSGGPLTCGGILVGVTSHGYECGVKNYPGIYMDVAYYRGWIITGKASNTISNFALLFFAVTISVLKF